MRLESLSTEAHLREEIEPDAVHMPGSLLAAILSGLALGAVLLMLFLAVVSQLWQMLTR
jgi:hypothetical protein